jgi:hypothetical protein
MEVFRIGRPLLVYSDLIPGFVVLPIDWYQTIMRGREMVIWIYN